MESLFFWMFAAGLIGGSLAVILARNPVTSALCLALTLLFQAALFVTLEAFFLAMVEVIVYAGAVMVLFLFIIMLLDIKAEERTHIPYVRLIFMMLLGGVFAWVMSRVLMDLPNGMAQLSWGTAPSATTPQDVGKLIFTRYILPFELIGVMLLMATVGVVVLSRKEDA